MKLSFHIRLFINLILFFSVLFIILGTYYYFNIEHQLYQEMASRSRVQAEEISLIPSLRRSVEERDISAISKIISPITQHSDASFIVIGDDNGKHLFHSKLKNKIGSSLVGGDNQEVLQGKTITSIRQGGLGISLRSKAPIFNDAGKVVGLVSVGYLTSRLDTITLDKWLNLFTAAILLLAALFIFSWFFSHRIKRQMFSLEPREIGLLVRRQQALMESIYEGVIAIDEYGRVAIVNRAAKRLLGIEAESRELRGHPIEQLITSIPFFSLKVMHQADTHDEICIFNHLTVIASRVRIILEGKLQGWVITFRDRNEIDSLNLQLSQVQHYVDSLRIVRHEQLNRMSTLAGMLHMGHNKQALEYIHAQTEHTQELLDFISARFESPTLIGLLLGKYAYAKEKGVTLQFDPSCQMSHPFVSLCDSELISIVGNLIDNAIDATIKAGEPYYPIEVMIRQSCNELMIEVADQGTGILSEIRDHIFEPGFTTKLSDEHGIGLHLIDTYVRLAGGTIEISKNTPRGTIFSLFIPNIPGTISHFYEELSHDAT